ncbi:MAG: SsrA-binding protein SmpB [Holosporales bacterium]|jgi:SsrA-binding protein|nr:SsrA-binding protein SmpB [Holosporales bacterium]
MKTNNSSYKVIAENRKVSFNYFIIETLDAGVVLQGSEVKSIRQNRCSISESFVGEMVNHGNALFLFNTNIPIYESAKMFNHEPKSPRKLLLRRKEVNKLLGCIRKKGMTIVPLIMFFNDRGLVKVKIALVRGKNVVDKRVTIKEREWSREKSRILKNCN